MSSNFPKNHYFFMKLGQNVYFNDRNIIVLPFFIFFGNFPIFPDFPVFPQKWQFWVIPDRETLSIGRGLFPKFFGRPHFPDSDFSLGGMDHKKHQRSKYGRAQLHLPPKNHNGGFQTPGLVGQKLIFSKPNMLYIIGSRIQC